MKTHPSADVVIVGGGWAGLLMAKELGTRSSLSVLVLERGGPRRTTDYFNTMDEVENWTRYRMMQDFSLETITLRHHDAQRALPLRQPGRSMRPHVARLFRNLHENRGEVRCQKITARPLGSGLGCYVRRDRTVLRAGGKVDRRFRQSRKSPWKSNRGWQRLRGLAEF